uniref:Cryptide Pep-14 n=1 Tax=Tityus obscurus TaxID=1221240 RepID=CRY14_TITOB
VYWLPAVLGSLLGFTP